MPYRQDLAWVHDVGFGAFAGGAAPGLLSLLRARGIRRGLVVDLGCGSGIWARALTDAGYDVLGIDSSTALLAIARRRAPRARFRRASLWRAVLPPCVAVTAIGEAVSYLFDRRGGGTMDHLCRRVHRALSPGGLFVLDFREGGRPGRGLGRSYREGKGWAVLVDAGRDRRRREVTRHITVFRKVGAAYRRAHEIHRLRLRGRSEVAAALRAAGFRVTTLRGYGRQRLLPGVGALAAAKSGAPARREERRIVSRGRGAASAR